MIDADYRGIVFVLLFNLSDKDFQGMYTFPCLAIVLIVDNLVEEGDRVAQLIIEKIHTPEVLEVNVRVVIFSCTSIQMLHSRI